MVRWRLWLRIHFTRPWETLAVRSSPSSACTSGGAGMARKILRVLSSDFKPAEIFYSSLRYLHFRDFRCWGSLAAPGYQLLQLRFGSFRLGIHITAGFIPHKPRYVQLPCLFTGRLAVEYALHLTGDDNGIVLFHSEGEVMK